MNSAVIVAGGIGLRIGSDIPKQFLKIKGKEILSFSVKTFLEHPQINEVIIVSHPDWIKIVSKNYPNCKVIKGGERRQDSSLNGVLESSKLAKNILIHDAARPFISKDLISNCLEGLSHFDGVAPILKVSNSLIKFKKGKGTYIDRSKIREVQTPQCFNKKLILNTLSSKINGTDEIGMVLKKYPDAKLNFIKGDIYNKKITSKIDLNFFQTFLK